MFRGAWAFAGSGLLVGACTAISGLDGDFVLAPADAAAPFDARTEDRGSVPPDDAGADAERAPDGGAEPPVFDAMPPTPLAPGANVRDASLPDSSLFCDPPPGARFCWDFGGSASPPEYGWNASARDGGTIELTGDQGTPSRRMQAKVDSTPGAGPKSASLEWNKWGSGGTDATIIVAADRRLVLSFSFRVVNAATYAEIAALQLNGFSYGLAVHPRECLGVSCLGENRQGTRAPDLARAAGFSTAATYRASVTLTRIENGALTSWTGEIRVGERVVSVRNDAIPGAATTPLKLHVGAFNAGTDGGTSQTEVDDILLERF